MRLLLILLLMFASAMPAIGADIVEGRARVVDGDTLVIGDFRIRLHGIDAPETGQLCRNAGGEYACGAAAASTLRELVARDAVRCIVRGYDRYGRAIAVCRNRRGIDVSARMVELGLALAYRKYSTEYVSAEQNAMRRGAGMWAGEFLPPWEWRAQRR